MRWSLRALLVLALAAIPFADVLAQSELAKRDARGPVTVVVTPTPSAAEGVLKVKVALDTHSVALDGIVFEKVVFLKPTDGADVHARAVEEATGSGHHRSAVLVFPRPAERALRLVVREVGGVAERVFAWDPWPAR